jgi:hypothetical protein
MSPDLRKRQPGGHPTVLSSNADWMAELAALIGPCRLRDIVLPGTHGSCTYAVGGSSPPSPDCPAALRSLLAFASSPSVRRSVPAEQLDRLADGLARLARLQSATVSEQLSAGVRYLDIQVAPRPERSWNVLNVTRMTGLPKAEGKPCSGFYDRRHRIAYRDARGNVWDVSYGGWKARNLTRLARSGIADSSPVAIVRAGAPCIVYRDGNDHICILYAQGRWKARDLTEITGCPRAAGSPVGVESRGEHRIFFHDEAGELWQLSGLAHRWDSLNLSKLVGLPKVVGDIAGLEHDGQVSVYCRDADGAISEIYFDRRWNRRALSRTVGGIPPAAALVAAADRAGLHSIYRDAEGEVWQLARDGERWKVHNLTALTGATRATGNLAVARFDQLLHVVYRDIEGDICDLYGDGEWKKRNLTQTVGTDKAVGTPAAIVYRGELHVVHRDINDDLGDLYLAGAKEWRHQNLTRATGSPRAARDPTCAEWQGQHHVLYRGDDGAVHDLYYDSSEWTTTRLAGAGGPLEASGNPVMVEYHARRHVVFRGADGRLRDIAFDDRSRKRDLMALASAPRAAGDPALAALGLRYHVVYRGFAGRLWQLCYDRRDRWKVVDLTQASASPPAAGNPLCVEYHAEHHVIYRDRDGEVWDLRIGPECAAQNLTRQTGAARAAGDLAAVVCEGEPRLFFRDADGRLSEICLEQTWKSRRIGGAAGLAGPAGDPAAAVFHGQAHIAYRDGAGHLRHLYHDAGWEMQDLSALARCPTAATDPLVVSDGDSELHVLFRDHAGELYDVHSAPEAFYACRLMYAERIDEVIGAVASFLARHPKEVVVLDVNRFHQMTERSHEALANKLLAAFGSELVALPRSRLPDATLDELWRAGQRVLVLYNHRPTVAAHPQLWSDDRARRGARARGLVSAPVIEASDTDALQLCLRRELGGAAGRPALRVLTAVVTPEVPDSWAAWVGDAVSPLAVVQAALETMQRLESRLAARDRTAPRLVAEWARDEWAAENLNILALDHFEQSDLVEVAKLINRGRACRS